MGSVGRISMRFTVCTHRHRSNAERRFVCRKKTMKGKERSTEESARPDNHPERTDRRRALRETLMVAVAMAIAAGAGVLGLWIAAASTLREDFQHYLAGVASAAAQQVDPQLHRALRDPSQRNGDVYLRAVAPLRTLAHVQSYPSARQFVSRETSDERHTSQSTGDSICLCVNVRLPAPQRL